MRIVRIEASWDTFLWTVSGHPMREVTSDLPTDARVLNVDVDHSRRLLFFTVESATFADLPEGHAIPQWQPTLTVTVSDLAMLAGIVSKKTDEALDENFALRQKLWDAGIDPDA